MATTRRPAATRRQRFTVMRGRADRPTTPAPRVDGLPPELASAWRQLGHALRRQQQAYDEERARANAELKRQRQLNLALVKERQQRIHRTRRKR